MCRKAWKKAGTVQAALIFESHADCPGSLVTIWSNHHFGELFGNRGDRPHFNWLCFSPASVLAPLCQSERQSVVDRRPVHIQRQQPISTLKNINSCPQTNVTSVNPSVCGRDLSFSCWEGCSLVWSDVGPGFGAASPSHNYRQLV